MPAPRVLLKPGKEKKIRAHYPWVQREEVREVDSGAGAGDVVQLRAHDGQWLGLGLYSPSSRFPVRVLTLEDEPIDARFFQRQIQRALERRSPDLQKSQTFRLLFAEADLLPGLIVDRYQQTLVVQSRVPGMDRLRELWLPALLEVSGAAHVYERSDMEGRREEGLEPTAGVLAGTPPELEHISENGLHWEVPFRTGPKTGFYLDQRENRAKLATWVKPGERVLDAFTYTGGFALHAARAGAEVVGLDILPEAVELAKRHAEANAVQGTHFEVANAFEWLEATDQTFDVLVLDPPAISKAKNTRNSLKWAVWKLIYLGLPRLRPGGRIVAFSCSYQMSLGELIETARLAVSDRGQRLWLQATTLQPEDHPYLTQFPESLYLKGIWATVE